MFGSAFAWTIVNYVFAWLFLGPALVVLFRIALKALRGVTPDFKADNMAILEDAPSSLVAGILFALPFTLWSLLDHLCRAEALTATLPQAQEHLVRVGVPVTASAAVFVHFAFHIFVFPVIAETHSGVIAASQRSRELADAPGRGGSRLLGLGRHLLFTLGVFIVLFVAARAWAYGYGASVPVSLLLTIPVIAFGPPAVAVLAAWYLHVTEPHAPPPAADGEGHEDADEP
jgi:hypothetical protein